MGGWGGVDSWEAFIFSWPLASGLACHCLLPCVPPMSVQTALEPMATAFLGAFSHSCLSASTRLGQMVTWVFGFYRAINVWGSCLHEVPSILCFFIKAAEGGVAMGERDREYREMESSEGESRSVTVSKALIYSEFKWPPMGHNQTNW